MTYQEILTLINAGYTKADIDAMSSAQSVDQAPATETEAAAAPAQGSNESAAQPVTAPAPAEAKPQETQSAPAPAEAPKAAAGSDAERILKALGDLAKGVDVPPTHQLTIEEKLGNTILAAMGVKPKED